MKTILSLFLMVTLSYLGFAQTQKRQLDPTNMREGESVEYCYTHKILEEKLKDPAFAKEYYAQMALNAQEKKGETDVPKGTVYTIPVVFHIVHNNGSENISDAQIKDAMDILNRDYRKLNADANTVRPEFASLVADIEIQFELATVAPNGQCFKGITRTVSTQTSSGDGTAQIAAVVAGNDVYQGVWPHSKYLNIIVCQDIGGAAGYTQKPWTGAGTSQTNMEYNSIFVLSNYVGSIGTSSPYTSRTLTHEIGHWLNLDHVWGGTNSPGVSCGNDGVSDTPSTKGSTSCNLIANTCSGIDAYFGSDMIDPVENYMDYSYCSKMFTLEQATKMRTALTSSLAGRSNVCSLANLAAVGAGSAAICKAEFSTPLTTVCKGSSVTFTDESYNGAVGWTWTFTGGTPSSSTAQNPTVVYNTPGTYAVTLVASDGANTKTTTKTNYITVLPAAVGIPFYESFESQTAIPSTSWGITNTQNNAAWSLETTTGLSGTKCAKLGNFGQTGTNTDELISLVPLDLTSLTSADVMTLTFRYSYRKELSTDNEALKVLITSNCGTNWTTKKALSGSLLSSVTNSSSWKPTSAADWATVHVTNITFASGNFVNNFRYKFLFEGSNGNNIYLDDINIYSGAPSNTIVLGLEENNTIENLMIYPNPTEGELNLTFSTPNATDAQVAIQDITGKVIQNHLIKANAGTNLVLMDTTPMASGVYFVTIQLNGQNKSLQFIVK